jgi:tRNA wybutosine-synthesizing protein 1
MIKFKTMFQRLEKIGYRLVGSHSAVKVCYWCKNAIRGRGVCYKQKFYGMSRPEGLLYSRTKGSACIQSHRCVQMTPSLPFCTHTCQFCWRDISLTTPEWKSKTDEPDFIIDGCIEAQKQLLKGFGGNLSADKLKLREAMEPNQFAISLAGEPLMYPKINGLIEELNNRKITSFVVSNGTLPDVVANLTEPTNFYISLPFYDKKSYTCVCQPLVKDGWERVNKSLSMINRFRNNVVRITLVKGLNMQHTEKYAELLEKYKPRFVEVKAFMSISFARERLGFEVMPRHNEIKEFSSAIVDKTSYNIKDEQEESRVVLLSL